MIRIPFNRCVIPTTLDFAQITDRLESAIYDPQFSSADSARSTYKHQRYVGKIRGFKFLATPIIGHKYFHLPTFLSPIIEGNIDSLRRGYEISLSVKLNGITFALLLTCLGGLLTTISPWLDSLLTGIRTRYLTNAEMFALFSIGLVAYFYFAAWQGTKFFRKLFAKRLLLPAQTNDNDRALAIVPYNSPASIDILHKNLPFIPSNTHSRSCDPQPQESKQQSILSKSQRIENRG